MYKVITLCACVAAFSAAHAQRADTLRTAAHATDTVTATKTDSVANIVTNYGIDVDAGALTYGLKPAFFLTEKTGTGEVGAVARGVGTFVVGGMLGGIGSVFAGNLLSGADVKTQKMWLEGATAKVKCGPRPVFKFALPTEAVASPDSTDWEQHFLSTVVNPEEFVCMMFDVKEGRRCLPKKFSLTAMGKETSQLSTKNSSIPFEVAVNADGTFRVSFAKPLKPGQYGFVYKGTDNRVYLSKPCAFDFCVTKK